MLNYNGRFAVGGSAIISFSAEAASLNALFQRRLRRVLRSLSLKLVAYLCKIFLRFEFEFAHCPTAFAFNQHCLTCIEFWIYHALPQQLPSLPIGQAIARFFMAWNFPIGPNGKLLTTSSSSRILMLPRLAKWSLALPRTLWNLPSLSTCGVH